MWAALQGRWPATRWACGAGLGASLRGSLRDCLAVLGRWGPARQLALRAQTGLAFRPHRPALLSPAEAPPAPHRIPSAHLSRKTSCPPAQDTPVIQVIQVVQVLQAVCDAHGAHDPCGACDGASGFWVGWRGERRGSGVGLAATMRGRGAQGGRGEKRGLFEPEGRVAERAPGERAPRGARRAPASEPTSPPRSPGALPRQRRPVASEAHAAPETKPRLKLRPPPDFREEPFSRGCRQSPASQSRGAY